MHIQVDDKDILLFIIVLSVRLWFDIKKEIKILSTAHMNDGNERKKLIALFSKRYMFDP